MTATVTPVTSYARVDYCCPLCRVQAVQRGGIVTVPHDEKCPHVG